MYISTQAFKLVEFLKIYLFNITIKSKLFTFKQKCLAFIWELKGKKVYHVRA